MHPEPPRLPVIDPRHLDPRLQRELRSDHAGETGAVAIYRGILALSGEPAVRRFAEAHLATEREHLAAFESWLPGELKSRLLPLWRLSGWLLGAVAALGGARLVFLTIEAVETFVVEHYRAQLPLLADTPGEQEVAALLRRFMDDEDHHRADALRQRPSPQRGRAARLWVAVVAGGSGWAVVAARRI